MNRVRDWLSEHHIYAVYVFIGVVLLIGLGWYLQFAKDGNNDSFMELDAFDDTKSSVMEESVEKEVIMYVDVKGAVAHPGIYEVSDGMRVATVLELAGGISSEADDKQVNLAERVTDQMVIYVPTKGEDTLVNNLVTGIENKDKSDGLVNINQATKEEIMSLNGIGEKKAERIIEYREEHGSFQTVEELKEVDGIGDKTFDSLKSWLTI